MFANSQIYATNVLLIYGKTVRFADLQWAGLITKNNKYERITRFKKRYITT